MAKIQLKGIVKHVSSVETVGDKGTKKQSVGLFVPGYVDEFGDKKGRDEEWEIDLFNEKITNLGLNNNLVDKRAVVTVYVSSNRVQNRDGKDIFIINANLGDIKLLEPNQANSPNMQSSATASKAW